VSQTTVTTVTNCHKTAGLPRRYLPPSYIPTVHPRKPGGGVHHHRTPYPLLWTTSRRIRRMHYPYHSSLCAMLIKTSYRDVPTKANGRSGTIRIYLIEPNVPEYPEAKFPGCVVFSEIYQVTGPVER
jgi:hypothetical protein